MGTVTNPLSHFITQLSYTTFSVNYSDDFGTRLKGRTERGSSHYSSYSILYKIKSFLPLEFPGSY